MVSTQTLIVVLLVVAIVFSIGSIALTLSLQDVKPVQVPSQFSQPVAGNSAGGVGLVIGPSGGTG